MGRVVQVSQQHFNQVEVWTLTVSLQHLDSFLFFSHSAVDLLLCLGSLSSCMTKLGPRFCCRTDGLTFRVLAYGQQGAHDLWQTASPNDLDNCVWQLICCICCILFSPCMVLCIMVKTYMLGFRYIEDHNRTVTAVFRYKHDKVTRQNNRLLLCLL